MLAPAPGTAPTMVPMTEPRMKVGTRRMLSRRLRNPRAAFESAFLPVPISSIIENTSVKANRPIKAVRKGMPS